MTAEIERAASVALDQITQDDDFWFRHDGIDLAHRADLASTLKNTGRPLDPVLLWQPDADDAETLFLLDGAHRVEAYRITGQTSAIPATILVGVDRRMALGAASRANSKRNLGLSQAERMDAAWRLVREPVSPRFKVREIVVLADVAGRTVDNMRARFRVMHEEGIEFTGSWARDKQTLPEGDNDLDRLTDDQREAQIDDLAAKLRDLTDRRKHPEMPILCEKEAVFEAFFRAYGERD